jgi:plastocyanin
VLKIATNTDKPLGYEPNELTAPASTVVEVDYSNNTALPHNIHFFAGPDENSPSIAKTDIQTGPGASASVTFTTPSQPGDYFFWCDVHQSAMTGTLHVTQ